MTNIDELRVVWDGLAERDALGAILTDPKRLQGGWDIAEFMATGETEIATVIQHLDRVDCLPENTGAALDFGCGVGRLTQALATRFTECVGVDISEHMIEQARKLNSHAHCLYLVNTKTRLPFANECFTFVYSNIVLQHMEPPLAKAYLKEFVRVLEPGGVLVFGVQDEFRITNLHSFLFRLRERVRLRTRIKALLGRGSQDMEMHCLPEAEFRETLEPAMVVDRQFTNTSAKDFNGKLFYLAAAPASGYVGRQYCVRKPR